MKIIRLIPFVIIMLFIITSSCDLFSDDDKSNDTKNEIGDTLWVHELPGRDSLRIEGSLAIDNGGNIIYAAGGGTLWWTPCRIYSVNGSDGSLNWHSKPTEDIGISSQIVIGDDGTIFVIGGWGHKLFAVDPGNGSFKWEWEIPEKLKYGDQDIYTYGPIGALALTDDGNLILSSGARGGVYARAIFCVSSSGNTLWHNIDATSLGTGGIFLGLNNTAYYYSSVKNNNIVSNNLVALNVNTGKIKWLKEISSSYSSVNNIAFYDDGTLVAAFKDVGDDHGRIHKIDPQNGTILWSGKGFESRRNWIGADGQIYGYKNSVWRINSSTGESEQAIWMEMGAITNDNNLVGAFNEDNVRKLGAFNPDNTVNWSVNIANMLGHTIVIDDNSVVYGMVNRNSPSFLPDRIFAIQGHAPLAKSNWPRQTHDNRNTCNLNKY